MMPHTTNSEHGGLRNQERRLRLRRRLEERRLLECLPDTRGVEQQSGHARQNGGQEKKCAVQPSSRFALNMPSGTTIPETIPIRLRLTT
jgi:hypothetical protein